MEVFEFKYLCNCILDAPNFLSNKYARILAPPW